MNWKSIAMNFVIGGTVTALIVGLEESNHRLLSGLATLIPIFTLVSYLLLGQTRGGVAVGQHSWMVLVGTLVSWVPYMVVVAVLAPRLGTNKAVGLGLACFFIRKRSARGGSTAGGKSDQSSAWPSTPETR